MPSWLVHMLRESSNGNSLPSFLAPSSSTVFPIWYGHSSQTGAVPHLETEIREYLRASEILMALLKTGKALSREEMGYIEAYTMRIQCLLNADENTSLCG